MLQQEGTVTAPKAVSSQHYIWCLVVVIVMLVGLRKRINFYMSGTLPGTAMYFTWSVS